MEIEEEYHRDHPGHRLDITCTYRSPDEQFGLFCTGRVKDANGVWIIDTDPKTSVVTNCDGKEIISRHNTKPVEAIDFEVRIYGKISWDPREYEPVGILAEQRGLIWGGRWPHLRDYPHVELPK